MGHPGGQTGGLNGRSLENPSGPPQSRPGTAPGLDPSPVAHESQQLGPACPGPARAHDPARLGNLRPDWLPQAASREAPTGQYPGPRSLTRARAWDLAPEASVSSSCGPDPSRMGPRHARRRRHRHRRQAGGPRAPDPDPSHAAQTRTGHYGQKDDYCAACCCW